MPFTKLLSVRLFILAFVGMAESTEATLIGNNANFMEMGTAANPIAWTYQTQASGTYYSELTLNWMAEGGSAAAATYCP